MVTATITATGPAVVDAEGLAVDELATGLRAWAHSMPSEGLVEGVVELLVGHGYWLDRSEFHDLLWVAGNRVEGWLVGFDPAELAGMAVLAAAPPSELAVLHLAVEFLGFQATTSPLSGLLTGLDGYTTWLVLEAVTRTAGHQHGAYRVTGRFGQ
jgi:hypothetical protein